MTQTNSNDSVALLNSSHIRMKQQINTGLINVIISFWLGSDPLGAIRWANVHRSSTLTLFDLNRTSLISFNGNICVYFTISGHFFTFPDQHVSVSPTHFSMESLILAVFFSLPPLVAFTLNQAQATLSFFTAITWNSYCVWVCVHWWMYLRATWKFGILL